MLSRVLGVAQSAPDDWKLSALGWIGRELVRRLREQKRSLPMLYSTLYMSGHTKDAVMRDELDPDVMVREKPFSHEQLAAKVREMLDGTVTLNGVTSCL